MTSHLLKAEKIDSFIHGVNAEEDDERKSPTRQIWEIKTQVGDLLRPDVLIKYEGH